MKLSAGNAIDVGVMTDAERETSPTSENREASKMQIFDAKENVENANGSGANFWTSIWKTDNVTSQLQESADKSAFEIYKGMPTEPRQMR